jgi:hypothetical protein
MNSRHDPLLQLDCELAFALGRLALCELDSSLDDLGA